MNADEAETGFLKQKLRSQMKALRSSLHIGEREDADAAICSCVLDLPAYQDADTVFTYLSFGSEVDTRRIVESAWADGKAVALPRCTGPRQMRWFRVSDLGGLERSPFGVEEPRVEGALEVRPAGSADAVAIVPGLSFDADGYRLGYGGGYYDAFLAAFEGASVGLCRCAQLSAVPLPRDCFDLPVDIVATEAGAFMRGAEINLHEASRFAPGRSIGS